VVYINKMKDGIAFQLIGWTIIDVALHRGLIWHDLIYLVTAIKLTDGG
jgi:hypothetical protein